MFCRIVWEHTIRFVSANIYYRGETVYDADGREWPNCVEANITSGRLVRYRINEYGERILNILETGFETETLTVPTPLSLRQCD